MKKQILMALAVSISLLANAQKVKKPTPKKVVVKGTTTKPATVPAVPKVKIVLGEKTAEFNGTLFNSITYNFSSKEKTDSYYYVNNAKKQLEIIVVGYEYESDIETAKYVTTYICPLAKINKKDSYNIDMDDETVAGGKYYRLTLITNTTGANNTDFTKINKTKYADEADEKTKVNNVTINITDKTNAEKWLKEFTK